MIKIKQVLVFILMFKICFWGYSQNKPYIQLTDTSVAVNDSLLIKGIRLYERNFNGAISIFHPTKIKRLKDKEQQKNNYYFIDQGIQIELTQGDRGLDEIFVYFSNETVQLPSKVKNKLKKFNGTLNLFGQIITLKTTLGEMKALIEIQGSKFTKKRIEQNIIDIVTNDGINYYFLFEKTSNDSSKLLFMVINI